MKETSHLDVVADAENLEKLVDWIASFCLSHSPAAEFEFQINLCVEELFLNVVHHTKDSVKSNALVHFSLWPQTEGVVLVVEDTGAQFNPLTDAPEPDINLSIEDRPIGGLGLKLIKEMSNKTSYQRVNDMNRLMLVFGHGPLLEN
ncbi:MAG: ATP-binding protein [Aestuariivita sp.]|nr:ATP-binding protein [Aestuariivita sp.]